MSLSLYIIINNTQRVRKWKEDVFNIHLTTMSEHLLCTRHCSKYQASALDKTDKVWTLTKKHLMVMNVMQRIKTVMG